MDAAMNKERQLLQRGLMGCTYLRHCMQAGQSLVQGYFVNRKI